MRKTIWIYITGSPLDVNMVNHQSTRRLDVEVYLFVFDSIHVLGEVVVMAYLNLLKKKKKKTGIVEKLWNRIKTLGEFRAFG